MLLPTLRLLNTAPMETLRTDDFACWVHLALKKRAAAGPCLPGIPWWHFAVEVERVQRLMAVANPLKDGVQAVSTV